MVLLPPVSLTLSLFISFRSLLNTHVLALSTSPSSHLFVLLILLSVLLNLLIKTNSLLFNYSMSRSGSHSQSILSLSVPLVLNICIGLQLYRFQSILTLLVIHGHASAHIHATLGHVTGGSDEALTSTFQCPSHSQ